MLIDHEQTFIHLYYFYLKEFWFEILPMCSYGLKHQHITRHANVHNLQETN